MGLYQRAHVLDPRLLTYLAAMYPQRCVRPKGALLLRPRLSHWAFFTLRACAFSTRQPQFCARPDEREKRTPKKGPPNGGSNSSSSDGARTEGPRHRLDAVL